MIGFDKLTQDYPPCWEFGEIYTSLTQHPLGCCFHRCQLFTILEEIMHS